METIMEKIVKLEGYKRHIFLCNEMDRLFDENKLMGKYKLNVTRFRNRYNMNNKEFALKVEELKNTELSSETFNIAYANLCLSEVNSNLQAIFNDFSDYMIPIKKIYSSINTIRDLLKLNNEEQFKIINTLSKELIDDVDNIENYADEVVKRLVIEASNVLYDVIMKGYSLQNDELINYINTKKDSINRQLLTSKLRKDVLGKIDKPFFGDIEFNKDIISSVMNDDEDIETKRTELNEVREKIEGLKEDISDNNKRIRQLKNAISEYKEKYSIPKKVGYNVGNNISRVIPILTTATGIVLCYGIISQKCETKEKKYPTHITYNCTTDEVIKKENMIFNYHQYEVYYKVYTNWMKSETNGQYYRHCFKFFGSRMEPATELTEETIKENFYEYPTKTEYKKVLDENDSTEKGEIILDEYIYEIDKYRPGFLAYSLSAIFTIMCAYAGFRAHKDVKKFLNNKFNFYKYTEDKKLVKLNEEEMERLAQAVEELQSELSASILKEEELASYEVSDLTQVLSRKEMNQTLSRRR